MNGIGAASGANGKRRYSERQRKQVKYFHSQVELHASAGDASDDEEHRTSKRSKIGVSADNNVNQKLTSWVAAGTEENYQRLNETKSSKRLPKQDIFPFMKLPGELRNRIYRYLLTDSAPGHYIIAQRRCQRRVGKRVMFNWFKLSTASVHQRRVLEGRLCMPKDKMSEEVQRGWELYCLGPKILRLSKEIHDETIGLLYSRRFIFADTNALHDFLVQIGPRMRPKLRDIEVAEWGYTSAHKAMNFPAMSLLADALGLERVMLNICHWEVIGSNCQLKAGNGINVTRTDHSQKTLGAKIYRDCSAFLLAWGHAKGRKDAAVDILELPCTEGEQATWQTHKCIRSSALVAKVIDVVREYVKAA